MIIAKIIEINLQGHKPVDGCKCNQGVMRITIIYFKDTNLCL